MRTKQVLAVLLCAAMVSSGLGMISMAENSQSSEQAGVMPQKTTNDLKGVERIATPTEPEELPDILETTVPSEPEELPDVSEATIPAEPKKLAAPLKEATPSEATYVSDESELHAALSQSGDIVLENEIQITKILRIPPNVDISLEGGKITFGGDKDECRWPSMIWVSKGAEVTLSNITIDATGMDRNEKNNSGRWKDYYAIWGEKESKITLGEGANIITSDNPNELKNSWKRGMWIEGICQMEGGTVSGFADIGIIAVGEFTMSGGEIFGNGYGTAAGNGTGGLSVYGKNSNRKGGYVYLEGGSIRDNAMGVYNGGTFKMTGGEITENNWGLISNVEDGILKVEFFPDSILTGGTIENNRSGAVWNKKNGRVTIDDTAEISGDQRGIELLRTMAVRSQAQSKAVIKNEKKSILNINGGTITSYSPDEIAIFNDSTSKLMMTGGTITAAGTAIRNENATAGDVKLTSGKIQVTGTTGKAIDNSGYIEATSNMQIESESGNQYLVAVNHNEGGQISPSTTLESAGKTIHFEIKPDTGYQISDVTVDGVSKGAVYSLDLTVEHAHEVVAKFVKRQNNSNNSSSSSSSSSSSGSSRTAAKSSIPETPGSWVLDQTGWKYINNKVPYSNTWVRKNNAWYWIGADGYMKTGWNLISGKWYYMSLNSGEMKTGWITDQGFWYYMDGTGARAVGWIQSGDKWYYLNSDGKMAVNTTTPDGYRVDETGAWVK